MSLRLGVGLLLLLLVLTELHGMTVRHAGGAMGKSDGTGGYRVIAHRVHETVPYILESHGSHDLLLSTVCVARRQLNRGHVRSMTDGGSWRPHSSQGLVHVQVRVGRGVTYGLLLGVHTTWPTTCGAAAGIAMASRRRRNGRALRGGN